MRRNVLETIIGAVVLIVAGVFLLFAYTTADLRTVDGYDVNARFDRIDGIQAGTDVRISGVRVGSVRELTLDPNSYRAILRMSIDPEIQLPLDTVAIVTSEGLLGDRYVSLDPGGDPDTVGEGEFLEYTQSTPGIEQLLGQVIFSLQGMGDNGGSGSGGGGGGLGDPPTLGNPPGLGDDGNMDDGDDSGGL